MSKEPDSREKTILAAARLLRRQGYEGTALSEILIAAGSPRGSLYFHFPGGKEEIGEAALAFAAESVRLAIATAAQTSENAEVFLTRIVTGMTFELERSDYVDGCPIAPTALETSGQSAGLGAAARDGFQKWELEIRRGLESLGLPAERADLVATQFLCLVEGALLLSRTYRSSEPLNRSKQMIAALVR